MKSVPKDKGKKLVYVPSDLLNEVSKVSDGKGESVGRFVEEALRQSVRASSTGYDLKDIADFFEVMQVQRNLGGTFVPFEILNYLTGKAFKDEKQEIQTRWYESGRWYGRYLKERFEDPLQAFKLFLEASRWDLNEVNIKHNAKTIKLRCISTVLTAEATNLLAKFIEGIVESLGFRNVQSDNMRGMILLEFEQEQPSREAH